MTIAFEDHAGLTPEERDALLLTVSAHRGLDEHDVLVPLPSGRWLVYGST
jgi:hypothetical protein